jgi:N-acetylgalactosamine-N,N'-diacetylbacillosaminyl-diphospho-undecaprenol 4-alpha-N-acetylgalactosaminyltransferase
MSKRISILIISLAGGGGEREAAILTNYFHKKYDTTLYLLNNTVQFDLADDVKIKMLDNIELYKPSFWDILKIPFLAWRYKKECTKCKIDTSFSFLTRTNLIAACSKFLGNKSKVILCEVTTLGKMYGSNSFKDRLMNILIKILYNKADLVIPNSKGSHRELLDIYGVKNATTIYNPLDLAEINLKKELKPNTIFDTKKFTFVKVARFQYPKDFETLLNAFSLVKEQNSQLLLIGVGEDKVKAEKLCGDLGIEDRVQFIGFDRNPFAYLSRSDCFVFSSLLEGFPNSMQEAIACNLPIISTDCENGPREMIASHLPIGKNIFEEEKLVIGNCGILVPVGDAASLGEAMNLVIQDKVVLNNLREYTKKIAPKFALENIVAEFEKHL